jgi:hypothetical protein
LGDSNRGFPLSSLAQLVVIATEFTPEQSDGRKNANCAEIVQIAHNPP